MFSKILIREFQLPLEEKIEIIAKEIYGADGIDIQPEAQQRLSLYKKQARHLGYPYHCFISILNDLLNLVFCFFIFLSFLFFECVVP